MDSTTILATEACQRLGPVETCSVDVEITAEYADSFKGLGCLLGEYKIRLDPSVPPAVHAPRELPVALHEFQRTKNYRVFKKKNKTTTDRVKSTVILINCRNAKETSNLHRS